jgi:chromosome partitioning protein
MENNSLKPDYTITPIDLLNSVSSIGTLHGIHKLLKNKNIPTLKLGTKKLIPSSSARDFFKSKGFEYPHMNINFHIIKGGVGKSSLASALAIRANMYGARVLCIDFDQQGNFTRSLGIDGRKKPVWLHIFRNEVSIEDAIIPITKSLHLIPSSMNNSRLELELANSSVNLKDLIRDNLRPVRNLYDLVIFDCPPSLNKTTAAVACASDLVLMPINADGYSIDALNVTIEELKNLGKNFKIDIPYSIIWNKYDQREKLSVKYLHDVASNASCQEKVLPVVIRVDASIKNALDQGISVFELAPKAGVAEDLDRLTKEVLGIQSWKDQNNTTQSIQ